ncbi:zinc finger protein OZF-like [Stegastes partitus]|uniref:Zinc finger protein OZF-like n=1 Tax=Stegastes partitus TaxID=144197 RepID=A0A9Y4K2V4_9TELE|nr:PREDICTED: zinc finger protein OZF-like [Stegastes partitus]
MNISSVEVTMNSVQNLRELINERLTAAAEEIFKEFEKTIVQYEEEIDRQRRMLDIIWKPQITLHTFKLPQYYVCQKEEFNAQQQLCHQEGNCSLEKEDPDFPQTKEEQEELCTSLDQEDEEPPQIKEEVVEICTSLDGEKFVMKQETDIFVVTPPYEESEHTEREPKSDQLLSHESPVVESSVPEVSMQVDSGSTRKAELKPEKRYEGNSSCSKNADNSLLENNCDNYTGKKPLTQDICGKTMKDKSKLTKHFIVPTAERPFACETCGKSFRYSTYLKVHTRIHTGEKPYLCNTCGKRFSDSSTFRRHVAIHTGEKPFSCSSCGKSFSHSGALKVHMRIHTNERPYLCNTCGKGFPLPTQLRRHTRSHMGERPYLCNTCGKSFGQSCTLKVHMRMHTGERPYLCNTCGKSFGRSDTLKVHIKVHTGDKS